MSMEFRVLGRTGLDVSEIGLACGVLSRSAGEAKNLLRRAMELGCTFFDGFGREPSEELLGATLAGVREKMVLATQGGIDFYRDCASIDQAVEKSLERLKTTYLDLYQLQTPPLDWIRERRFFDPLLRLKEKGRVRFIGVTVNKPAEGFEALRHGVIDTLQVPYSVFNHECSRELIPACDKAGVGVIVREPLAGGLLAGKYSAKEQFPEGDPRANWTRSFLARCVSAAGKLLFLEKPGRTLAQACLRFLLANEHVSVVIPGARTVQQVEENLGVGASEPLDIHELEKIFELCAHEFDL